MSFVSLALKEWAVITRALARGEQFLVLRKGGIREQQKRFVLEGNRFLLYPTYEHQSADLLKPQWHDSLAQTLTQAPSPDTVIIDTLAEVVEILEITEPERVTALTDFYICTDDYAQYQAQVAAQTRPVNHPSPGNEAEAPSSHPGSASIWWLRLLGGA